MITKQTRANQQLYSELFQKATYDLMSHDSEGNIIANPLDAAESAAMRVDQIASEDWYNADSNPTGEVYESGKYYRWDASKKNYILAEEQDRDPEKTYYKANDITSLNLYFSYLKSLTNIDKIYTMLPLDENVFEIEANSREIKVPKDFADNGISVQGDEISEILYFKIDRYFDAVDLATKDVCIQWRAAGLNEDGTTRDGMSAPWLVDYKTYKDCIVFGWPISSAITKDAGEISFAIRFYEFNKITKKIEYSFATLTQKVMIKPSLDFNIEEALRDLVEGTQASPLIIDDNTALIRDRTEDSQIQDGSYEADVPEFIKNLYLDNDPIDLSTAVTTDPNDSSIQIVEGWLDKDSNGFRNLPVVARVCATGGGRITYNWRKLDIDTSAPLNFTENPKFIFVEADLSNGRKDDIDYYIKVSDEAGVNGYEHYDGDCYDPTDVENFPASGLYERYSSAIVDSVGQYIVTVTNRVYNSTKQIRSYKLLVKRPVKLYRGNAAEGEQNNFDHDLESQVQLSSAEAYQKDLSVEVSRSDAAHSKLTYQWQKRYTPNDNWVNIEGATGQTYTINGTATAGPESGDGYYQVIVYNNLNNEQESCESGISRVTHMPSKPTIIVATPNEEDDFTMQQVVDVGGLAVNASIPTAANENRTSEDKVTYQWYKYEGVSGNADRDTDLADQGTYEINGDTAKTEETAENTNFVPDGPGRYFCHVTNYYNGQTDSRNSLFFRVI